MMGSLKGIVQLAESGSLLLRRRTICDLILKGVAVGMDWFESAVICNLEGTDALGIFLEAGGRITKELCSLLLRA
jgi:hypothetical protein